LPQYSISIFMEFDLAIPSLEITIPEGHSDRNQVSTCTLPTRGWGSKLRAAQPA
jgi:hypothetical protein